MKGGVYALMRGQAPKVKLYRDVWLGLSQIISQSFPSNQKSEDGQTPHGNKSWPEHL